MWKIQQRIQKSIMAMNLLVGMLYQVR